MSATTEPADTVEISEEARQAARRPRRPGPLQTDSLATDTRQFEAVCRAVERNLREIAARRRQGRRLLAGFVFMVTGALACGVGGITCGGTVTGGILLAAGGGLLALGVGIIVWPE